MLLIKAIEAFISIIPDDSCVFVDKIRQKIRIYTENFPITYVYFPRRALPNEKRVGPEAAISPPSSSEYAIGLVTFDYRCTIPWHVFPASV